MQLFTYKDAHGQRQLGIVFYFGYLYYGSLAF